MISLAVSSQITLYLILIWRAMLYLQGCILYDCPAVLFLPLNTEVSRTKHGNNDPDEKQGRKENSNSVPILV